MAINAPAREIGRMSLVVSAVLVIGATAWTLGRLVIAVDGDVFVRLAAGFAIVAAGALLCRPWRAPAFRETAAVAGLLATATAIAPTAWPFLLVAPAGIRLGRDVGGWAGIAATIAFGAGAAAGAAVQGAAVLPGVIGATFVGVFLHGAAEPERGAWCACEFGRRQGIRNLDLWFTARAERRRG